jgi:transposase
MKGTETKQEFIQLRAKGLSFDKIAKELKMAKQTLIDWSKEFEEEIANLKALELEALQEQYFLMKQDRLKNFGNTLNKLREEVEKRNLKDLPTDKLLELYLKYNNQVKEEIIDPAFKSSQDIREEQEEREALGDLTAPEKKLKTA